MKLPNVDAGFFGAAMKLQDTIARAPLPFSDHQTAVGNLRAMVEHVEGLTGEVDKLREEVSKLQAAPSKS